MTERIKKIFIDLELNSKIVFWLIWVMIIICVFGFLAKNYDLVEASGAIIYFLFIFLVFWRLVELQKSPQSFSETVGQNLSNQVKDDRIEISFKLERLNRKVLTVGNILIIVLYFLIFGSNTSLLSLSFLFLVLIAINLILAFGIIPNKIKHNGLSLTKPAKISRLSKKNKRQIAILNICILGIYFINYGFNLSLLKLMVLAVILLVINTFSIADSLNEKYG